MKYKIEFELPDNETVLKEIKTSPVKWAVWGYTGYCIAKPIKKNKERQTGGEIVANDKPLDTAKKIIKEHYKDYNCGIFDSPNIVGDPIETIYKDDSIEILGCYDYSYFEVFGLSKDDFDRLEDYYNELGRRRDSGCTDW